MTAGMNEVPALRSVWMGARPLAEPGCEGRLFRTKAYDCFLTLIDASSQNYSLKLTVCKRTRTVPKIRLAASLASPLVCGGCFARFLSPSARAAADETETAATCILPLLVSRNILGNCNQVVSFFIFNPHSQDRRTQQLVTGAPVRPEQLPVLYLRAAVAQA